MSKKLKGPRKPAKTIGLEMMKILHCSFYINSLSLKHLAYLRSCVLFMFHSIYLLGMSLDPN